MTQKDREQLRLLWVFFHGFEDSSLFQDYLDASRVDAAHYYRMMDVLERVAYGE